MLQDSLFQSGKKRIKKTKLGRNHILQQQSGAGEAVNVNEWLKHKGEFHTVAIQSPELKLKPEEPGVNMAGRMGEKQCAWLVGTYPNSLTAFFIFFNPCFIGEGRK